VSIRGLGSVGLALVVSVVLLGVLALPAFAAAPEEPVTVSPAKSITATSATLEGVLNPNAAGEAGEYEFFYSAGSECTGGSVAPEPAGIALGVKEEAVSVGVSGLLPGTQYTFCVFERNAANPEEAVFGQPVTFTTPAVAPVVSEEFATGVASDSATLGASIVPGGAATTYHFQYGTSAAYGQSTPESASVGADDAGHAAGAHIQGLQPGTAYHYRVVATSSVAPGGVAGPDQTFTTQSGGGALALPDGRAYELVTPADKGSGFLAEPWFTGGFQASTSGDGLAYAAEVALAGSLSGSPDSYLATRGAGGWSSQNLTPPQATQESLPAVFPRMVGFSADLSKAVLLDGGQFYGQDSPPLVSGEPQNNFNLFLRDNATGAYQLMDLTPAGVGPGGSEFEGLSADGSHVVFRSYAQLTPGAPGDEGLYQWAGGSVSLVSQIPQPPATTCGGAGPPCVASFGILGRGDTDGARLGFLNAVSPDGSKVFFKDLPTFAVGALYMRENNTRTVDISASQRSGSGPEPGGETGIYQMASADGSEVFFISCEQLTNDATGGCDLYRYDTASGVLSDLTVDHNGDPAGADVQGVVGASADGSYVYFVANGVLASGASLGDCHFRSSVNDPEGQCNLYVSHEGTVMFIARLDNANDHGDWINGGFGEGTARVTPDGTHLVFESVRSLTGYDNTVASGTECGKNAQGEKSRGPRCSEVFLYDAASRGLVCVSCNASGARPLGPSHIAPEEERSIGAGSDHQGYEYLPRNLSDDGSRVFFDSVDALVPGDVNGRQDVYEWEGGRQSLISSGTSSEDSTFVDASPSGGDVFFKTISQLVSQDVDQRPDIYDARIGGGFPGAPVPPPPCVGEACKAPPAGQVLEAPPGSASFVGAGNLSPAPSLGGVVRRRPSSRARKLAAALRVCRREPRRRRGSCVARAHRLYGPVGATGRSTRSAGRGK
jgi:WD40-like Beta Propeller Repeat